jgi:diguanylate cyclase
MPTKPAPLNGAAAAEARQLAKAALHRLVIEKLEPTPENYARAYRLEAGEAASAAVLPERAVRLLEKLAERAFESEGNGPGHATATDLAHAASLGRWEQAERLLQTHPAADAAVFARLIERIVRGVERGSRVWTSARRKDSLQRVLDGSRSDARRLQQRLAQLVASWDADGGEVARATDPAPLDGADAPRSTSVSLPATLDSAPQSLRGTHPGTLDGAAPTTAHGATDVAPPRARDLGPWRRIGNALGDTVACALGDEAGNARELQRELDAIAARVRSEDADAPFAESTEAFAQRARQFVLQRQRLIGQLGTLCGELTSSLAELAEDDSWVQGQCHAMRARIGDGLTGRGVRAVGELLRDTRERQARLRTERQRARDSLKGLIQRMLSELDELGSQTGNFHDSVGRYADVIEKADSLESLAGVVREMAEESRSVQSLVQQTQARLHEEHHKARELNQRVAELEDEMRRLSEEVSTDQLTQVANRRGMMQAFEAERSRLQRGGGRLAVGLLDIDNFKRLNDELGHGAGDEALKALAARVSASLRPTDSVARYGGEEFVVLLPETPLDEAQAILTRLQRSLTGGLFMHERNQVFVTFSAGVTEYREGEEIEQAIERADQALYEAKRTGKNRTCSA